jgi:hypothetical protein
MSCTVATPAQNAGCWSAPPLLQGLFTDIAEGCPAKRKRHHLRDSIDWEVISKKVKTRDPKQCMSKWYMQLRPSMTDTSEWARGDDMTLLTALWHAKPLYVRSCSCMLAVHPSLPGALPGAASCVCFKHPLTGV